MILTMKTSAFFCSSLLAASCGFSMLGLEVTAGSAQALTLDLIESGEDPIAELTDALLAPDSGISIISGSEIFVGSVGDGNNAQSATYTDFNLVPNNQGLPTITNPDGIFLTSGTANIPFTNTDTSFDPFIPGTGSDADLSAILSAAGLNTVTNDVNFLQFDFTVDPDSTSVEADFVFGSDEFPDQSVTDVFAFIVDDTNFAFFQDGSLVSFVAGANADNFNDNDLGTNNYNLEYDGISNSLSVVGILDEDIDVHTLKIAIADTSDSIFDSGVFIGNLEAGQSTGEGGIVNGTVPEPTSIVALLGIGALGAASKLRNKKA